MSLACGQTQQDPQFGSMRLLCACAVERDLRIVMEASTFNAIDTDFSRITSERTIQNALGDVAFGLPASVWSVIGIE